MLEDWKNTTTEGPYLAFEKLLLNGQSFAGVCFERLHTRQHRFLEEVPVVGAMEAGHGNDIGRILTIAKKLEGDRRLETL